ncbi:MAG TPA: NAD(P)-dependent oxidoreductase [Candidatus Saccharimonadia bacterium]|nr:NAD(P)-dependent oxidoreductase [Candidatus Saccharimonadia bacterium]
MTKPHLAFFDVHELDQSAYRAGLADEFELTMSEAGLTAAEASGAEVISVHVTSQVTAEVMAALPKLKLIACRTTGYDNVDLAYAAAHDIAVVTVPAYGQDTVAEYAFLLMMAVSRRLMLSAHSVRAQTVTPTKLTGHELAGKTLGIIGTGRIGRQAARIARGFSMTVIACDVYPNPAAATELGFTYAPLPEVLAAADYLTLHAPATPETHHLLGAQQFAQMKPGVFIVNTARGSLIDTPALIAALNSGHVAGAGLDVLEGEELLSLPDELTLLSAHELGDDARHVLGIDILRQLPNVLITSHNAYNSFEALGRIRDVTIANIHAWRQGKPQNVVEKHE